MIKFHEEWRKRKRAKFDDEDCPAAAVIPPTKHSVSPSGSSYTSRSTFTAQNREFWLKWWVQHSHLEDVTSVCLVRCRLSPQGHSPCWENKCPSVLLLLPDLHLLRTLTRRQTTHPVLFAMSCCGMGNCCPEEGQQCGMTLWYQQEIPHQDGHMKSTTCKTTRSGRTTTSFRTGLRRNGFPS